MLISNRRFQNLGIAKIGNPPPYFGTPNENGDADYCDGDDSGDYCEEY